MNEFQRFKEISENENFKKVYNECDSLGKLDHSIFSDLEYLEYLKNYSDEDFEKELKKVRLQTKIEEKGYKRELMFGLIHIYSLISDVQRNI